MIRDDIRYSSDFGTWNIRGRHVGNIGSLKEIPKIGNSSGIIQILRILSIDAAGDLELHGEWAKTAQSIDDLTAPRTPSYPSELLPTPPRLNSYVYEAV